ncbi:hypothetical protein SLS55_005797 [Diplodia seriata]|uniref:Uncharacterized protein n=1 Tax=Diplodia seriata TaxID=420778 RepID=A0ABR3CHE5_9PEZI
MPTPAVKLPEAPSEAHEETQLLGEMNQQIQNILGDLNGACRYVQDGENVHPNRLDNTGGAPGQQQQQTGTFARGNTAKCIRWKGQPVQYMNGNPCYRRPDNGAWERIWLPDGAPPENPYCYAKPEVYGEVLKEAYEYLNRTGTFKDGIMPEEPPMHTAIRWDV